MKPVSVEKELIVLREIGKFQNNVCSKLKITSEELDDILSGKKEVSAIVYESEKRKAKRKLKLRNYWGRASILLMFFLLVASFTIDGFADNIRERLLSIVSGNRAVSIESIQYQDVTELRGVPLPSLLPAGYHVLTHAKGTETDMVYVDYVNDEEQHIRYFFYPNGSSASHDNEQTIMRTLRVSGSTVRVGVDSSGKTFVFAPYDDADYIHIEFDQPLTDRALKEIVESIQPIQ